MLASGVKTTRLAATLLVGSLLILPALGCLTRALWSRTPTTTVLEDVPTRCLVHAVTVDESRPAEIDVVFSADANPRSPGHIRRFDTASERRGRISLRPRGIDGDWRALPGAEHLIPRTWDFRVTRGSYFRGPDANARLTFHGTLAPGDVVQTVLPGDLPARVIDQPFGLEPAPPTTLAREWEARCFEGFAAQRWIELLEPENAGGSAHYHQEAIAWLDPDRLQPTELPEPPLAGSREELGRARRHLVEHRLLVRLESAFGKVHWIAIPGHLLQHGADLRLHPPRDEDAPIRWSRTQVWSAALALADDQAFDRPYEVPLRSAAFEYRWLREHEQGNDLPDVLRVVFTPITAIIDFLVLTNPWLSNALRELSEETAEPEPEPRQGQSQR